MAQLRRQTGEMGLDPNRWFRNVEVAAAREVGRETVQYVSNIFKYVYRRVAELRNLKRSGTPPSSNR